MTPDFKVSPLSDFVEGEFELSPSEFQLTKGLPEEYPLVARLKLDLDLERLREDFQNSSPVLRRDYLEPRVSRPMEEVVAALRSVGFTFDKYAVWALMKTGTCELAEETPAYTAAVLTELSPICRAHYVIARPGIEIAPHVDCHDYRTHGFRLHIPIFNSAHYIFYSEGSEKHFELTPGSAWFVNNAVLHSAYNRSSEPRVSLLFQMMSDSQLLKALDV